MVRGLEGTVFSSAATVFRTLAPEGEVLFISEDGR
jgi:hypothetical protein